VPRQEGQDAVTEAPSGLLEASERLGPHDPVHRDPALLLELADRPIQVSVEVVAATILDQAHPVQPGAHLGDRRPRVPTPA
jgi:hypothetical protein